MTVVDIESRDCKVPGCSKEANWKTGIYGGLCEEHAKQKPAAVSPAPKTARVKTSGIADKVKQLGAFARDVDRKRAAAAKLAAKARDAAAQADALEADFHNLARELMGG
jgi:hypothetical protein